jgi:hypothetical protein
VAALSNIPESELPEHMMIEYITNHHTIYGHCMNRTCTSKQSGYNQKGKRTSE